MAITTFRSVEEFLNYYPSLGRSVALELWASARQEGFEACRAAVLAAIEHKISVGSINEAIRALQPTPTPAVTDEAKRRPTIAELEAILAMPDSAFRVEVQPNGEVRAVPSVPPAPAPAAGTGAVSDIEALRMANTGHSDGFARALAAVERELGGLPNQRWCSVGMFRDLLARLAKGDGHE